MDGCNGMISNGIKFSFLSVSCRLFGRQIFCDEKLSIIRNFRLNFKIFIKILFKNAVFGVKFMHGAQNSWIEQSWKSKNDLPWKDIFQLCAALKSPFFQLKKDSLKKSFKAQKLCSQKRMSSSMQITPANQ